MPRAASPRPRHRSPAVRALQGLVLAGLVAGTTAWSGIGKTVTVTIDGEPRVLTTSASTVAELLADQGLAVSEHDLLAPAGFTELEDGDRVALRRGRPLQLVVDGEPRTVWVTAESVEEALDQLGLGDERALVSASRSREIPLEGLSLDVRLPKDVQVLADGKVQTLTTTAPTVREALAQAGVVVRPTDRVSTAPSAEVADGLVVRVTRIDTSQVTDRTPLPFRTVRRPDDDLPVGETKVLTPGRPGVLVRVFEVTLVDGKASVRRLLSKTRQPAPTDRVVLFGTERPAEQQQEPAPTNDGLNWAALARCESGGNPRAVSSTGKYRGLYQFSLETWRSVGGSGDPIDASSAEQTRRAQILYNRAGRGQWPHCGRYL